MKKNGLKNIKKFTIFNHYQQLSNLILNDE